MEIRDTLCDLGRMEIPRPQFHGMQFVATRGRIGFYKTIRQNGGKYGLDIKAPGPRRPVLSTEIFVRPSTVKEESVQETASPEDRTTNRYPVPSSRSLNKELMNSNQKAPVSRIQPNRMELEPDYPSDYVPPHLRINQEYSNNHKTTLF